jgi:hypothetical protein
MIASSSPGMTLEVLKADVAARARAAEERRHLAAMTHELRSAGARTRRARRRRRLSALRGHLFPRLGHQRHDSTSLPA